MSNFEKIYTTDTEKENDGTWVELHKGIRICIRSARCKTAVQNMPEVIHGLYERWLHYGLGMPNHACEHYFSDWLAEYVLVDWQGVTMNGVTINYSHSVAKSTLMILPRFMDDIARFARDINTFRSTP